MITLLLLGPLAAQEQQTSFSLEEAIQLSLSSSHVLEQARAVTAEREAGIDLALAPTRPRLGLEANGNYLTPVPSAQLSGRTIDLGRNWNYRTTAFLRQTLADFGRSHHKIEASRAGVDAAQASEEESERLVALATSRAYFQALSARALLTISEDEVLARRELLENSEAKVREGAAARYDLVRSRAELAAAEVRQSDRLTQYEKALLILWSLTDVRRQPLEPTYSPLPPSDFTDPLEEALQRPELAVFRALIRQQEQLTLAEAAENRPRISFQSEYTRQTQVGFQLGQQWQTGLLLEIPLYDGGQAKAKADSAEARTSQLRAELAEVERQIALEVESAYLDFVQSSKELEPAQRRLDEAQEAHRLSQLRYEVGLTTLQELLETRTDLTTAQSGLETARVNLHLAWVEWLGATGRLRDGHLFTHVGKIIDNSTGKAVLP